MKMSKTQFADFLLTPNELSRWLHSVTEAPVIRAAVLAPGAVAEVVAVAEGAEDGRRARVDATVAASCPGEAAVGAGGQVGHIPLVGEHRARQRARCPEAVPPAHLSPSTNTEKQTRILLFI
jgi:hypothetical protein